VAHHLRSSADGAGGSTSSSGFGKLLGASYDVRRAGAFAVNRTNGEFAVGSLARRERFLKTPALHARCLLALSGSNGWASECPRLHNEGVDCTSGNVLDNQIAYFNRENDCSGRRKRRIYTLY